MSACYYCGCTGDLRPYGPNCAMVCFDCAMATPDRKAEAERQFVAQLNGIDDPVVIDGSEAGPYPARHNPAVDAVIRATKGETP